LVCANDVIILGENVNITKKKTQKISLLEVNRETSLKVNIERTKYMFMSRHQNARQGHNLLIGDK